MTRATRTATDAAPRPSPRPRNKETDPDTPKASVHNDQETRRRGWKRSTWTLAALSVLLVLSLAVGGLLFWRDREAAATESDRADVILAARQEVLNLIGLSHTDTDATFGRLLAGATGDFRNQLAQQADSFKQAVNQGQVASTGQISEAGVERLDGDTATTLVVAGANIKNTQVPQGEKRQYRLRLTLQRQDGRWLVSQLEFVA